MDTHSGKAWFTNMNNNHAQAVSQKSLFTLVKSAGVLLSNILGFPSIENDTLFTKTYVLI